VAVYECIVCCVWSLTEFYVTIFFHVISGCFTKQNCQLVMALFTGMKQSASTCSDCAFIDHLPITAENILIQIKLKRLQSWLGSQRVQ